MVNFTVGDGTNYFALAEMEILFTGSELDTAEFVIAGQIALNASITIYADSVAQFIGYVKDVEEIETGLFKYTAYEKAVELKTQPYLSGGLDIFTKTSTTVNALALDILTSTPDSGWTIHTSSSGYPDTTAIASMNFYMVNRLQGINKILREIRGYFVIFDSNAKTVKYLNATGINTDRSTSDMAYATKRLISSSMLRGITQVTVIGKDSSIRGDYGSSTSSRICYQVDDIETNDEALKIATAIFGDIGVTFADYEVEVEPSQTQYDVRDKVQLDGTDYWIKEIVQRMDGITLTLDDGRTSVVDSLGKRIHVIEGNFPEGADNSWSGGNSNVAANGALETTYIFDVKDAAFISTAELDVAISTFDKNVAAVTAEYLSAPSKVSSNGAPSDESTFVDDFTTTAVTMTNMATGFQDGQFTLYGMFSAEAITSVTIYCEISINGGTFTLYGETTGNFNNSLTWQTFTGRIKGSNTAETGTCQYQFYVESNTSNQLKAYYMYTNVDRISRHVHTIVTTDNKITAANTPASTVYVKLNSGGTYTEITPGTPVALTTLGTLASGKNTIYVKTPATSTTNMCSVNPTIAYQSFRS